MATHSTDVKHDHNDFNCPSQNETIIVPPRMGAIAYLPIITGEPLMYS